MDDRELDMEEEMEDEDEWEDGGYCPSCGNDTVVRKTRRVGDSEIMYEKCSVCDYSESGDWPIR